MAISHASAARRPSGVQVDCSVIVCPGYMKSFQDIFVSADMRDMISAARSAYAPQSHRLICWGNLVVSSPLYLRCTRAKR